MVFPIKTAKDYMDMPADKKKRLIKEVVKKANQDQANLVKRYEKAVAQGKIQPV